MLDTFFVHGYEVLLGLFDARDGVLLPAGDNCIDGGVPSRAPY